MVFPGVRSEAAISLSAEFFAPAPPMRPSRGADLNVGHCINVIYQGDVMQDGLPGRKKRSRHQLERRVLCPGDADAALEGGAAVYQVFFHGVGIVSRDRGR